jgi:replicative superfamily II helicase
VYDSARGAWVDLSVLDVLQVFGRAGRPGLETEGEGYICTTEDKLDHYLQAVTSQVRIVISNGGTCSLGCAEPNRVQVSLLLFVQVIC